MLKSFSRY